MDNFSFRNKTIIIISQQDWGKVKLSKHLYAEHLSKTNKIYFLYSVPVQQSDFASVEKVNENLSVVRISKRIKGIHSLPKRLINAQSKRIVKKILRTIHLKEPDVVWSFEQSRFQNLTHFNAKLSIFHPVDYLRQALPFLTRIANSADLVLSISKDILDQINTSSPKYFIHHGLDEIFTSNQKTTQTPNYIDTNKVNVGYIGNLQIKLIDWPNMIKVVEDNPTLNFIFIGPDKVSNIGGRISQPKINDLKDLPNTTFTGAMHKEELVNIMPFLDIFWLCYDTNNFPIEVSNSHKIMEYLSTGKVVVSNPISTYKDTNYLQMSNTSDLATKMGEVAKNIETHNSESNIAKRKQFSFNHTYAKNIQEIERIINELK